MVNRHRLRQYASREPARGALTGTEVASRSAFRAQSLNNLRMEAPTMNTVAKFAVLVSCLTFAGSTLTLAQEHVPPTTQIVALDECDPTTFNAALGADFCKNVTLGEFTTLRRLIRQGSRGNSGSGLGLRTRHGEDRARHSSQRGRPGRRAPHVYRSQEVRWRLHSWAQCPGRRHRSRMLHRLFEPGGGQDSNPSRQHDPGRKSAERETSLPVLHPSVDASAGGSEVTVPCQIKRATN